MITVKQAYEAYFLFNALSKLDDRPLAEGGGFLPYATKLKLATRLRKLKPDASNFEQERMDLAKKLGEPVFFEQSNEDREAKKEPVVKGYRVSDSSPNKAEWDKSLRDLQDAEADVEVIRPLEWNSLGENKLSTGFIMQLQDSKLLDFPPEDDNI
jgi:hypothetical protein